MREIDYNSPVEQAVYLDRELSRVAGIARLDPDVVPLKYRGTASVPVNDQLGVMTKGVTIDKDLPIEPSYVKHMISYILAKKEHEFVIAGIKDKGDLAVRGVDLFAGKIVEVQSH